MSIAACLIILISLATIFSPNTTEGGIVSWIDRLFSRSVAINNPCGNNLRQLGNAIVIYAHGNDGQFPTPEKWCDLLMIECKVPATAFICPNAKAKKGKSSYAFNENLVGIDFDSVGPDTIVLFESKPGPNQIAGPNSWNPANHGGKGSNVLTRSGQLYFERSPKGLLWGPGPFDRKVDNAKE